MPPRSSWHWVETWPRTADEPAESQLLIRNVGDGVLCAVVSLGDYLGWHMTLSTVDKSHSGRYPTWEEALDARTQLLPDDVNFVVHLQPAKDGHIHTLYAQQHPSPGETENGR